MKFIEKKLSKKHLSCGLFSPKVEHLSLSFAIVRKLLTGTLSIGDRFVKESIGERGWMMIYRRITILFESELSWSFTNIVYIYFNASVWLEFNYFYLLIYLLPITLINDQNPLMILSSSEQILLTWLPANKLKSRSSQSLFIH